MTSFYFKSCQKRLNVIVRARSNLTKRKEKSQVIFCNLDCRFNCLLAYWIYVCDFASCPSFFLCRNLRAQTGSKPTPNTLTKICRQTKGGFSAQKKSDWWDVQGTSYLKSLQLDHYYARRQTCSKRNSLRQSE